MKLSLISEFSFKSEFFPYPLRNSTNQLDMAGDLFWKIKFKLKPSNLPFLKMFWYLCFTEFSEHSESTVVSCCLQISGEESL